jgi:hypothetical protein
MSSLPELASLDINPEYLRFLNQSAPGIARYVPIVLGYTTSHRRSYGSPTGTIVKKSSHRLRTFSPHHGTTTSSLWCLSFSLSVGCVSRAHIYHLGLIKRLLPSRSNHYPGYAPTSHRIDDPSHPVHGTQHGYYPYYPTPHPTTAWVYPYLWPAYSGYPPQSGILHRRSSTAPTAYPKNLWRTT